MIGGIRENNLVFYVWRGLAKVYRSTGEFSASESVCKTMLADALEGNYVHDAGVALFEIAETLAAMGRSREAAFALAVALKIPRSASPALRAESLRRREWFEREFGSAPLGDAIKEAGKESWPVLAARIVEGE
jgi:hypothetical protein